MKFELISVILFIFVSFIKVFLCYIISALVSFDLYFYSFYCLSVVYDPPVLITCNN